MKRSFVPLGSVALVFASLATLACSAESTTFVPSSATDGGSPSSAKDDTSAPAKSDDGGAKTDGGASSKPQSTSVTLSIANASYQNTTAASGGFVYAFEVSLDNDSDEDITSLDTMELDFGDGNVVGLTKPVCNGAFPVASGKSKLVEMQVVVSNGGSLSNFAFICPGKQTFGGASGDAPATAGFDGSVALTLAGKTSNGKFTATGSATRSN